MERIASARQVGRGSETSMVKSQIDQDIKGLLDSKKREVDVPGTFIKQSKRKRRKGRGVGKKKKKKKAHGMPMRTKSGKFKKKRGSRK